MARARWAFYRRWFAAMALAALPSSLAACRFVPAAGARSGLWAYTPVGAFGVWSDRRFAAAAGWWRFGSPAGPCDVAAAWAREGLAPRIQLGRIRPGTIGVAP